MARKSDILIEFMGQICASDVWLGFAARMCDQITSLVKTKDLDYCRMIGSSVELGGMEHLPPATRVCSLGEGGAKASLGGNLLLTGQIFLCTGTSHGCCGKKKACFG